MFLPLYPGKAPRILIMANYVQRTINRWFNRLLGAAAGGNFSGQEERHAANRTTRDYVWNTIGLGFWGLMFPLLTIVITQLVGVEQAGMFSMAFVIGLLLTFLANYGVRTFQISDIEEVHSFSDYQIHRLATCVIMIVAGFLYCTFRGYSPEMFTVSMGVYAYRMIDGLADVYEGRLQQMNKLYLAGISQGIRSFLVLVVFSLCLLVTRDLGISCIAMAVAAVVSLLLLTLPLALFETPKSQGFSLQSVGELFKHCFPLFIALFLFNLIDSMPKFVMEGMLGYDNQLYFNALYFPAQAILIITQFVYKPQLLRCANLWADPAKRKRFDLMILVITAAIVILTLVMVLVMGWFGLSLMGFLYGIDFEQFRNLCFLMLFAGGVAAGIDFLYQMITVLRQQKSVMLPYLITLVFAVVTPLILINLAGLQGIVIRYLIIMGILFVLLVVQYFRIRLKLADEVAADYSSSNHYSRRSELKAERSRRSRRQQRIDGRTGNRDAGGDRHRK
ncbi:MAG TPA: polysaccharide biosynthesis protein [Coriobacteriia bacterium]|nr:polysaccharide biosynthesis protein [Coriobacteriia bacterium]